MVVDSSEVINTLRGGITLLDTPSAKVSPRTRSTQVFSGLDAKKEKTEEVLTWWTSLAKIIALVRRAMLGVTLPCDYSTAERGLAAFLRALRMRWTGRA